MPLRLLASTTTKSASSERTRAWRCAHRRIVRNTQSPCSRPMATSRPGESWITSRTLPSERSWVRLAMSALGMRLPSAWWRRRRAGAAPGTPAAGTGSPGSRSAAGRHRAGDAPPRGTPTSRCGCPGRARRACPLPTRVSRATAREHVFGEADVAVLTADGRVGRRALEALHGAAQIVEQHERDRRSRREGPERPRRAAARSASARRRSHRT